MGHPGACMRMPNCQATMRLTPESSPAPWLASSCLKSAMAESVKHQRKLSAVLRRASHGGLHLKLIKECLEKVAGICLLHTR